MHDPTAPPTGPEHSSTFKDTVLRANLNAGVNHYESMTTGTVGNLDTELESSCLCRDIEGRSIPLGAECPWASLRKTPIATKRDDGQGNDEGSQGTQSAKA